MGFDMTPAKLLAALRQRGITLEADGERLRFSPRSAVTPELLDRLKHHKRELLASLSAGAPAAPERAASATADTLFTLDERPADGALERFPVGASCCESKAICRCDFSLGPSDGGPGSDATRLAIDFFTHAT